MIRQAASAALEHVTGWRRSSYSQGADNCVEVTDRVPGWVGVRDSKLGSASPILAFTEAEWAAFIAGVREDELAL